MGRSYTHLDSDAHRLPENMTRIAYDADTQVYTYRDESDGSLWESAPGVTYGKMFPVRPPSPLPSVEISADVQGDEPEYTLEEGPGYDPFGDCNAIRPEEGDGEDGKRGKGEKGGMRKRVDSVMERIASVREKDGAGGRRGSRRGSPRTTEYDEKSLEQNSSTTTKGHGHTYSMSMSVSVSEKETLPSRSSTLRTTGAESSHAHAPSSLTTGSGQQPQQPKQPEPTGSNLKRASTLSRLSRFLTGKRKEDDPDYDVTPGTTGPEWAFAANGSRVHRSKTVSAQSRPRTTTGAGTGAGTGAEPRSQGWNRAAQPGAGLAEGTQGRRRRATTFDEILAGIPGQH
ncbi:hypothetical protein B0T20DRAFT_200228 [Sordaria brevicollis]|uniref:Uncharacterized protein n=1 Tax=Sordaria brevicollis TaxID=83679 RepID=A0AAE0PGU6_SORBR|nr:hypothetical protein B0T20DRAFT_200228 [Sordaria brevicollis]